MQACGAAAPCKLPIVKMCFQPKAVNRSPLCLAAPTILESGRTLTPARPTERVGVSRTECRGRETVAVSLPPGSENFRGLFTSLSLSYTAENRPITSALCTLQGRKVLCEGDCCGCCDRQQSPESAQPRLVPSLPLQLSGLRLPYMRLALTQATLLSPQGCCLPS